MTVQELIDKLKDLQPDKEICIEGCNEIEIKDDGDNYEIEFWYSQKANNDLQLP